MRLRSAAFARYVAAFGCRVAGAYRCWRYVAEQLRAAALCLFLYGLRLYCSRCGYACSFVVVVTLPVVTLRCSLLFRYVLLVVRSAVRSVRCVAVPRCVLLAPYALLRCVLYYAACLMPGACVSLRWYALVLFCDLPLPRLLIYVRLLFRCYVTLLLFVRVACCYSGSDLVLPLRSAILRSVALRCCYQFRDLVCHRNCAALIRCWS